MESKKSIDDIISEIYNAEEPESVTNEMVAAALEDLETKHKSSKNDLRDLDERVHAAETDLLIHGTKISQTKARVDTIEEAIAKPDGIAPLDSQGKVPARHLPSFVDDVVEFAGFVSGKEIYDDDPADLFSTDAGNVVVYDTDKNAFLLGTYNSDQGIPLPGVSDYIYYSNWEDSDTFGKFVSWHGVVPISGKIYVCTDGNMGYRWSGSRLSPVGSSLALGHTAETAMPGDEGASVKAMVESLPQYIVNDIVPGRTADAMMLRKKRYKLNEDGTYTEQAQVNEWLNAATSSQAGVMSAAHVERLEALEQMQPQVEVAHKASSAKVTVSLTDADGNILHSAEANIGAVGLKAGLMKPEHVERLEDVENNVAYSYPSEEVLEDIEPNIITDALRKTEQFLLPQEQAQVLKNLGNPEFKLFIDMWNEAWGSFGTYDPENAPDIEHPFMGNGLWMTYKEAILVLQAGTLNKEYPKATFESKKIRTNLPITAVSAIPGPNGAFQSCSNLEVADVKLLYNAHYIFYQCVNVRKIGTKSRFFYDLIGTGGSTSFQNCVKLEEVYGIIRSNATLYLQDSPLIKRDCFSWIINNAINTGTATIIVHPDVYAKLTDETDEEWSTLIELAASKNIIFATL